MHKGWIKLHRKILHDEVFQNERLFKVFMYCLLKATHEDYEHLVGLQKVKLKPGQFIFGRRQASVELNMPESTVWRLVKVLESNGNIEIKSNNKFSVINVVKWRCYQHGGNNIEQQVDNKRTTDEQQMDTNKNNKNIKNNKKDTSRSKLKFETHHLQLAKLLFREMKKNNPNSKEPNFENWANTFRLMMERDNRSGKEIQDMILFSQQHDFWHKNILSPTSLRDKFDRLTLEKNSGSGKTTRRVARF